MAERKKPGWVFSDMSAKELSDDELSGMTVNERLFVTGRMTAFERAALSRDRQGMIDILMRVAFSQPSAAATTDAILANPSKYGYGLIGRLIIANRRLTWPGRIAVIVGIVMLAACAVLFALALIGFKGGSYWMQTASLASIRKPSCIVGMTTSGSAMKRLGRRGAANRVLFPARRRLGYDRGHERATGDHRPICGAMEVVPQISQRKIGSACHRRTTDCRWNGHRNRTNADHLFLSAVH